MTLAAEQNHAFPQVILEQIDKLDQDITELRSEVQESNRRFSKFHPNLKWALLVGISALSVLATVVGLSVAFSH